MRASPLAAGNPAAITKTFDVLVTAYGLNEAGRLHKLLTIGLITDEVRFKVRAAITPTTATPATVH